MNDTLRCTRDIPTILRTCSQSLTQLGLFGSGSWSQGNESGRVAINVARHNPKKRLGEEQCQKRKKKSQGHTRSLFILPPTPPGALLPVGTRFASNKCMVANFRFSSLPHHECSGLRTSVRRVEVVGHWVTRDLTRTVSFAHSFGVQPFSSYDTPPLE